MKNLQVFIHRNYDTIKLGLIFIIFILTFLAIIGQIQKGSQDAVERASAVAKLLEADQEIIKSIQAETEAQTQVINRQFRALCILIIDTSGQEGLNKLDPDTRAQCERLADNPETTQKTAVEQQEDQSTANPQSESQNNSSSSNPTPEPQSAQRPTSQPESEPAPVEQPEEPAEEPNMIQQVINNIRNLL